MQTNKFYRIAATLVLGASMLAVATPAFAATLQVSNDSAKASYETTILKAADRLITLQNANGSWDFDVTNATGPTATTYYNVAGVSAQALLDAYSISHDAKYLTAAQLAGDYIVSGSATFATARQNAFNAVFLFDLATASGNSTYSTTATTLVNTVLHADNYWSHNAGSNCDANGCTPLQLLGAYENYRGFPGSTDQAGIVPWDLMAFVQATKASGDSATAAVIEQYIVAFVTDPAYTNSVGNYALGLSGALRAAQIVGDTASASTLTTILTGTVGPNGEYGTAPEGQVQTTAYALLALQSVGSSNATAAAHYLGQNFGYSALNGWKDTDGSEYAEIDSEAAHALASLMTSGTYYVIQHALDAVTAGDVVSVGAGTYTENPTISKSLTLSGVSGAIISGQLSVSSANTTVSGLSFTNPDGNFGILINHVDNVTISGNTVDHVGTGSATGNVFGIYFQDSDAMSNSGVAITNNTVTNIGATTNGSNGGIGIGDSTGSGTLSGFSITGNTITTIRANTTPVSPGKGAYGIIVNHAVSPQTGTTDGIQIKNNTISDLQGRWAHLLGLEGATPNAVVTGNTMSNASATGGDASAIHFDDNASSATVTIQKNSFDTNTLAYGVVSSLGTNVDASVNYWNTGTTNPTSKVATTSTGTVQVSPWFTDAAMTTLQFATSPGGQTFPVDYVSSTTTTASSTATLTIASGTTITGPSGWDGTFTPPTVTNVYATPVLDSGFSSIDVVEAVSIGAGDTALTLDQAAKLVFTGQAGKYVGFSRGGVFTKITATCDSATAPTLTAGADCKIDSGADLIVWTKHFTTFVAYTQGTVSTASTGNGGGGGGGGGGIISGPLSISNTTSASTGSTGSTGSQGQVLGAQSFNFTTNLRLNSRGADVNELQKVLIAAGFLKISAPTGWFGPMTLAAVKQYQTAHNVSPVSGFVGPLTRGVLNSGN